MPRTGEGLPRLRLASSTTMLGIKACRRVIKDDNNEISNLVPRGGRKTGYQHSSFLLLETKKLPSQLSTMVEIAWHSAPRSHALPWDLKCVFGRLACVYNHWMRRYPGHGTNIMGTGPVGQVGWVLEN